MAAQPLRPITRFLTLAPPAAGALLLVVMAASCSTPDDKFPPPCPALDLAPNAGELTRFTGSGHDVGNVLLQARITAVPASCKQSAKGQITATLHVIADVTRGPAAAPTLPPVDYFVAVAEGQHVLQEHDFALVAAFSGTNRQATVAGEDIELLLPVTKSTSAAAYHIYVGFRLSADELAYNQSLGRK